jgi:ubiquinone/menaquinone biosynthesis C-methylase UbiE
LKWLNADSEVNDVTAPHPLSTDEIKTRYNEFARWYDVVESIPEFFGVRALRRRIAGRARGRTLEVAAGSGKNLSLLPDNVDYYAGDISREMLKIADRKAKRRGMHLRATLLDAESLPYADDSFDTVLSTLSSCTFPDPIRAFQEMSRVCKPDGRILLLEHGRSSVRLFAWYQDWRAEKHASQLGCQWNRLPVRNAREAGLQLVDCRTHFFGVFAVMEARPIDAS